MSFIEKILPPEGYICVAVPYPRGGFRHIFCETFDEAQEEIKHQDALGNTVFVAQATFKTVESRKQENALYLKNFFMDLDVDPDDSKKFSSQKDAATDLKKFVAETGLPMPAVVSSGNGLYAHWPLEEMVPAASWKTIANILKKTTTAYEFKVDQSRTADSASVLRPVGATHRKDPGNLKTVQLLKDVEPVKFAEFCDTLRKAAKRKQVDVTATTAPKPQGDLNADFMEGLEGPQSSVTTCADKCAQLAAFRDSKGDVDEPFWYAALGVMVHCHDGNDFIQEWSAGHSGYSVSATEAKAQQYISSGFGPSTCTKFAEVNPQGCLGCQHINKIKSPITLGKPTPADITVEYNDDGELESELPEGFRLDQHGLHCEIDGRWDRFYDQDLRISRIAFDHSLDYQVAFVKHTLPHDGTMEFAVRSSMVHDPKALMTFLSDNNVHVIGVNAKKAMVAYMESYISKLQRQRSMTQLLNQMGWKKSQQGKDIFVLGSKILHADGTVEDASLARGVPAAAQGFCTNGDLNKWTQATELFNKPGMEPFAFALLCGFAAPLMKFTGFDGAMVSMVGESGIGKTLSLIGVQSIYGNHKALMMLKDDTLNSLVSRLGVYGNLPMTIDEMTNKDGLELSDFLYRVTQGRDKARLNKNAEAKKLLNGWNTLAIVSTNSSLMDKLASTKQDASAEANRLFEYDVHAVKGFEGEATSDLFWTFNENYGHAGERYVVWLVQNMERITPGLATVQKKLEELADLRNDERFWAATASTAIYGGMVASKLGLIRFDVGRVMQWAAKTIVSMRSDKKSLAGDSVGILGQFLDEHANNRILVKGDAIGGRTCVMLEAPRGALVIRYEVDKQKAYISRHAMQTWLARRSGSYTKMVRELKGVGAIINPNRTKVLGGGTSYAGASQVSWEVDLTAPALGAVGLQLVQAAAPYEMVEKTEGGKT